MKIPSNLGPIWFHTWRTALATIFLATLLVGLGIVLEPRKVSGQGANFPPGGGVSGLTANQIPYAVTATSVTSDTSITRTATTGGSTVNVNSGTVSGTPSFLALPTAANVYSCYGFSVATAFRSSWCYDTSNKRLLWGNATGAFPFYIYDGDGAFPNRVNITTGLVSATNCAGVGTAANPSVVTCTDAWAGAFSCATAASTGTCVVNTTAVTANSEILVTQVVSEGTRLSVTCNTNSVLPTTPLLLSKSAGVSFTITLGTVAVNPGCFNYTVLN